MRTVYLECLSGVSGDMILASLVDTGIEFDYLKEELDKLNLDFEINLKEKKISGISTKKFDVVEKSRQPLRTRKDILKVIEQSFLSDEIKKRSKNILDILGKAEAKVHNTNMENIHFHEIGAIDTIVDIVGAVVLVNKLNCKVFSSKINLGSGFVHIEHGRVPVPAPASSEIAKDMLTFSTDSGMELATPTGLAILKGLSENYGDMPTGKINSVGYGAGSRSDDDNPNIVRAFVIESEETELTDEIHTNIDDCSGEVLGYCMEKLFKAGALDVYFTPIQMKKQRPGVKLSVICNKQDTEKLAKIIFEETTTTGVRINETKRIKVSEEIVKINVHGGIIRVKTGYYDNKLVNISPEYEDCRKIALENNISLKEVFDLAIKEFNSCPENVNDKT